MIPRALARVMQTYTAEVDPFEGQGSTGAIYGSTVSWPCYAEPTKDRRRSTETESTRATGQLWTFLDSPVKVGDRIRVGTMEGHVLKVSDFDSRGAYRTPDHRQVWFG